MFDDVIGPNMLNFLGLQPDKVKFELKLGQSKPIYNAFKAIKESPDWEALSGARKRIVEGKYLTIFLEVKLISMETKK